MSYFIQRTITTAYVALYFDLVPYRRPFSDTHKTHEQKTVGYFYFCPAKHPQIRDKTRHKQRVDKANNESTMPRCVLAEKCLHPQLEVRAGHKCPMCLGLVHVFCGVTDPNSDDLHSNVTCNACAGLARKEPPKEKTKDTRKAPPKEKKGSAKKAKTHRQAAELVPTKLKKSPAAQGFRLAATTGRQDPLIMKNVCFLANDGGDGTKLVDHFGGVDEIQESLTSIDGKIYLFGNVVRKSNLPKKGNANVVAYDVQWEDLVLGETTIDLQVIVTAIDLSSRMRRREKRNGRNLPGRPRKYRPDKLFDGDVAKSLFAVHEGEDGDPMDSDTTIEESDDDDDDDDDWLITGEKKQKDGSEAVKESYLEEAQSIDTRGSSRFQWRAEEPISPPRGKSNRNLSAVKPESVGCFRSSLSSFLAFVPLKLLKSMVYYSNMYAASVLEASQSVKISGAKWKSDISLAEMMTFWGILIKMVLRPTPGQSYTTAWKDPAWHPYTQKMELRRFQQIRSVLHANDNTKMAGSNDSLFKVRPFLNCCKLTFPSYLDIGNELALDEASVSSRSKFGGFSIFFNPTKPGGKFHFRFYLLCC
jgi:hypothetical protein